MYDELVKRLREAAEYVPCIMDREDAIKAADAIEKLCGLCASQSKDCSEAVAKYLELWVKQQRWIPVAERLPEKYHQVLVYGLNGTQIDYYAGEKSIGGHPLFMISEAKVTHWMPLPEPPKEE